MQGGATRTVNYNGTIGRFTISVLRDSVLQAVNVGNTATRAIANAVTRTCQETEPDDFDPQTDATCVSPQGLQTTGIRIYEEYDWGEEGRSRSASATRTASASPCAAPPSRAGWSTS